MGAALKSSRTGLFCVFASLRTVSTSCRKLIGMDYFLAGNELQQIVECT
jgi:hypothetical protein